VEPAVETVTKVARATLGDLLTKSGAVLYSSTDTLRSGPVYLLGNNPGGDGASQHRQRIPRRHMGANDKSVASRRSAATASGRLVTQQPWI
jgi:hypothetical protein